MKMSVLWDVEPYSVVRMVDVSETLASPSSGRRVMMEVVRTPETFTSFHQIIRVNIPQDIFMFRDGGC
jgi:hypothetical protein